MSSYWEDRTKRSEFLALFNCQNEEKFIKELTTHYDEVYKIISKKLEEAYKSYGMDGVLSLSELKQYVRIKKDSRQYKITRLEMLKFQITKEIRSLSSKEEKEFFNLLYETYNQSYYWNIYGLEKEIGYHTNFNRLDTNEIIDMIKNPWIGENYSNRIWKYSLKLESSLKDILNIGITLGESNEEMARKLKNSMNVKLSNAKRLVRTETNYISNQATLKSYYETEVTHYEYIATLDRRTSSICSNMEGKKIPIEKAEVGVNYPPLHPNCRSTTIPSVEKYSEDKRIARDSDGNNYKVPSDMTYKEWYDKYIKGNKREELARKIDKNLYTDKKQYNIYKVLGNKDINSFEKFQRIKYNDTNKWDKIKNDYRNKNRTTYLQERLDEKIKGEKPYFIPRNTVIEKVKVIAGKGSTINLRIADKLAIQYKNQLGDIINPEEISKKVGKIETSKYIHDIHWYEYNEKQFQAKIKLKKEKR